VSGQENKEKWKRVILDTLSQRPTD
jgi:hypothetical protein